MAKKTYEQKLRNINDWVEIVNYHWHRLKGDMYNDSEFWDDTLHAMQSTDWWDWVDISPALKIQFEDCWRRYPKLEDGTNQVRTTLMLSKPVTRAKGKGKNFEAFRLLMNIKDFMNDINGTPTLQYNTGSKTQVQEQPTQFELLFVKE